MHWLLTKGGVNPIQQEWTEIPLVPAPLLKEGTEKHEVGSRQGHLEEKTEQKGFQLKQSVWAKEAGVSSWGGAGSGLNA